LGRIVALLNDPHCKPLDVSVFTQHPAEYACMLPDDTLYFWNHDLDVDDDGYTTPREDNQDNEVANDLLLAHKPADWTAGKYHQKTTSLEGLSAFVHSYVVLPWGTGKSASQWWLTHTKCKPGDGAAIIAGDGRWTLAVFGDSGPDTKIGEMSLAAHAKFVNWDTLFIRSGARSSTREAAPQSGPLVTMVFPHTRPVAKPNVNAGFENRLKLTINTAQERFWTLAGHKIPPV
jgi:hypothetical protein